MNVGRMALFSVTVIGVGAFFMACGSGTSGSADTSAGDDAADHATVPPPPPGSGDGGSGDAGGDGPPGPTCAAGPVVDDAGGSTCTPFGSGPSGLCEDLWGKTEPAVTCGAPNAYVCLGGGPPGHAGCIDVAATASGEVYCCPLGGCVEELSQASRCAGVTGKPRYVACEAGDGGDSPPAGCVLKDSFVTQYYCCP
jgi:hypothetical protein